jgi:alkanesulfonate monooxygenase SsuD/methylene tetrahydromethanopterin reductase-like flavin-dependent oxidoreductase (luciferase family)
MKFGYFTLSDNRYPNNPRSPEQFLVEIRDQAVLAEKLGLNSAWIGEHHFNRRGLETPPSTRVEKTSCANSPNVPAACEIANFCRARASFSRPVIVTDALSIARPLYWEYRRQQRRAPSIIVNRSLFARSVT